MKNLSDFWISITGSIVAFFSGLALNDWASLFGILFGALSVFIAYQKYRQEIEQRHKEYELHEREMNYKILLAKIEAKKVGIDFNDV